MSDSVGARLRQARELRRLTLQQASESTKLRTHYLQALENDDYSAIPSPAQARGFLRIYAEFLGLDLAEIVPPPAPRPIVPTAAQVVAPATPASGLWARLRGLLKPAGPAASNAAGTEPANPAVQAPEQQVESVPVASAEATPVQDVSPQVQATVPADAEIKKNAVK